LDEPKSQTHEEIITMKRETRRDRRARLAPETLEGRELMSVAAGPGIKPGHHELRHLHPTTPLPHRVVSFQEPPWNVDPVPMLAPRVPKPATPAIAAAVSTPDATGFVDMIGQTYRKAKVRLALQANGTILQTQRADANGWFHFNSTVGFGSTPMRLSVTAHGHRPTSIILPVVRTRPNVLSSPGNPPTTSNNSPGTSGSSQTGSQEGNLSTLEKILRDSSAWSNADFAAWMTEQQDGGWYLV
jgi:hypothetical protein